MRSPKARRGFTLIEFVVGIVLLAIALTGILGLLINQAPQSVDPVQQVRGAQLAQRILGEVLVTQEPVRLLEAPFALPPYAVKQHWHERFHADAGNMWLRRTVAQLFALPRNSAPLA